MKWIRFSVLLISCLAMTTDAGAGWLFRVDSDGEKQTTMIAENHLKLTAPDHVMIFDVADNRVTFANPNLNTYWAGKPADFAAGARLTSDDIADLIEEKLEQAPPSQRDRMVEDMRRQVLSQTGGPPPTVVVKETDQTATVAGYATRRHEVHVNGALKQELWIAEAILPDLDVAAYGDMLRAFHSALGHSAETALSDPRVMALYKKGWPLRTILYDEEGYPDKTEVTEVIRKPIPLSEFEVPNDYRKLDSRQIFGQ